MDNQSIEKLLQAARQIGSSEILIINTNIPSASQLVSETLSEDVHVLEAKSVLSEYDIPTRQQFKQEEFHELFRLASDRNLNNLTHEELIDPKFEEYAPLIKEDTVLVVDSADELIEAAQSAFSMHISENFLNNCLLQINQIVSLLDDTLLSASKNSVIGVRNFDLSKQKHVDVFLSICFRPSSYNLNYLKCEWVPSTSQRQFVNQIVRSITALSDIIEERSILKFIPNNEEKLLVPDLFLESLEKDYSVEILVLKEATELYDILCRQLKIEPNLFIISICEFLQLITTYCDPEIHYEQEHFSEVQDESYYSANSFHLVLEKQEESENATQQLVESHALLKFLCCDPLLGLRYIYERFDKIIFISQNIEMQKDKELLSKFCRINYFNRKSMKPLRIEFINLIDPSINRYIRYEMKGSDQTLITSMYKDISLSMSLNYQKFIDERCSESKDGIIVCMPSNRFISEFMKQMQVQNLSLSNKQLSFVSSSDYLNLRQVLKSYKLCCDIGRGGVFVETCKEFKREQFSLQYNSITLIIGIPFPTKCLENQLKCLHYNEEYKMEATDYWCEQACNQIMKICSGYEAVILADMRYGPNSIIDIMKYLPAWFTENFYEESSDTCLRDLKNFVIKQKE